MSERIPAHALRASEWGDDPPLCSTRCMKAAALTVDGVPYCLDCAEAWFDRLQAIELRPELAELLPALSKVERVRLRRPVRLTFEEEEQGRKMMERLGKAWALSPFNPANGPEQSWSPAPCCPACGLDVAGHVG